MNVYTLHACLSTTHTLLSLKSCIDALIDTAFWHLCSFVSPSSPPILTDFLCCLFSFDLLSPWIFAVNTVFPHFNLCCIYICFLPFLSSPLSFYIWTWSRVPYLFSYQNHHLLNTVKTPCFVFCLSCYLELWCLPCFIHIFPLMLPRVCSVSGTLPSHLLLPWNTSHPQPWHALGPWSASRVSNSPSLTSPLRVLTIPQLPHRAWANCTQVQAVGATAGAHGGSGGVRLEPPGTEGWGQADQGQIQAAGTTWSNRSATEG